jgi:hypothetical protein
VFNRSDYLNITELLGRSWTRGRIDKLLGLPELRGGWAAYYAKSHVEAVEASPEFKAASVDHQRRRSPLPKRIDLLSAIFAVNRSAKRYRDAAQKHYRLRQHGFARNARCEKEELYELKDRGIAAAYIAGRLVYVGVHGRLAIYRGEGYCFHSTIQPRDAVQIEIPFAKEHFLIESRPRTTREPRLCDAVAMLKALPREIVNTFARLDAPRFPQQQHAHRAAFESLEDEEEEELGDEMDD